MHARKSDTYRVLHNLESSPEVIEGGTHEDRPSERSFRQVAGSGDRSGQEDTQFVSAEGWDEVEEVTSPIDLEWDPDEISQVLHQEEVLGNPLVPLGRSLNELGRSAARMEASAEGWAKSVEELLRVIELVVEH